MERVRLEEENKRQAVELQEAARRKEMFLQLEAANRELQETQAQLVQSEKMASLGQLVAGIAHEINTPVGAIRSMHDSLSKATARLKDALHTEDARFIEQNRRVKASLKVIDDATEVIESGSGRVAKIVRRLKSFARLDEAELLRADVHEGLDDTLVLLHHELKRNVRVHLDYGEVPPFPCFPSQLNQVFLNLLVNARQAIDGQGEIFVTTRVVDGQAHISIRDTGVGIPPENIAKIFDPGFTTKGVKVGTGLGLSICYRIVKEHRGEIRVDSTVGGGLYVHRCASDGPRPADRRCAVVTPQQHLKALGVDGAPDPILISIEDAGAAANDQPRYEVAYEAVFRRAQRVE